MTVSLIVYVIVKLGNLVVLEWAGYPPPKKQASTVWRLGDEGG